MFVGHLSLAFASKSVAPRVSLGWLMAAVTLLDLIWPIFLLLGIEHAEIQAGFTAFTPLVLSDYPWSHSLLMTGVWGVVFALLGRWRGMTAREGTVLFVLVVSHWILDFVSHAPDMPLWPGGSARLGLGLWNSIPATFVVEGGMWIVGIVLYLRRRAPTRWVGPAALWSFVVITSVMWALSPWSAPPPNTQTLAWASLIGWITLPWAALADRYYAPVSPGFDGGVATTITGSGNR